MNRALTIDTAVACYICIACRANYKKFSAEIVKLSDFKDALKLKKKKRLELVPTYDECVAKLTMLTGDDGWKDTYMEFFEVADSDIESFGKQRKAEVDINTVSACSWKPSPFCVSWNPQTVHLYGTTTLSVWPEI